MAAVHPRAPSSSQYLAQGTPPVVPSLPLVVTVLGVVIAALKSLCGPVGITDTATLDYVGSSAGSTWVLFAIRAACAIFFCHRTWVALCGRGVEIGLNYLEGSRFPSRKVLLRGPWQLATFTMQSWILHALYFVLATFASVIRLSSRGGSAHVSEWFPLSAVHLLFQATWAVSHLVTTVTSYVLVPAAARSAAGPISLMQPEQLVLHNVNVMAANLDAAFSRMRLAPRHAGAPVLWCCHYVFCAFILGSVKNFVPYFFLDFSLHPITAFSFLFGLLFVVLAFFAAGVFLTRTLSLASLPIKLCAHAALTAAVVRFKPPAPHATHRGVTERQSPQPAPGAVSNEIYAAAAVIGDPDDIFAAAAAIGDPALVSQTAARYRSD